MAKLSKNKALITGGNSGIGRATALLFARERAHVVITGRNAGKGAAVVAEIEALGGQAQFIQADVRELADCERVADEAGAVDILFNNAGVVTEGTVVDTPVDVWLDTLRTNVTGIFYMSRAILPGMIERGGGVVINNGSDWSVVGGQNAAAYCASKGAVANLTRAMALDHARQGVRVNAVCPGDTYVPRWNARYDTDDPAEIERILAAEGDVFPLGRVARVDEIARAVLFLACDDSSYMTGQLLVVDGGNTAGAVSEAYPTTE